MAVDLYIQDLSASCGANAYCSGLTAASGSISFRVSSTEGATAEQTFNLDHSSTNLRAVYYQCEIPSGATWAAGTWTVYLPVTTAPGSGCTWESVYVCRVNNSCTNQATIGSSTGLGISLATANTKSTTVSGSAQTPSAGDKVMVVFGFSNTNPHGNQTLGLTAGSGATVDVSTPFTVSSSTTVDANLNTLSVSTHNATVNARTQVDASLNSLSLALQQPTIKVDTDIQAGVVTLTVSPLNASTKADTNITAALKSLSIAANAATVELGVIVNASANQLIITPLNATVKTDISFTAQSVSLAIANLAASIKGDTTFTASSKALILSVLSAALNATTQFGSQSSALGLTLHPATITVATGINASSGALSLTLHNASVTLGGGPSTAVKGMGLGPTTWNWPV